MSTSIKGPGQQPASGKRASESSLRAAAERAFVRLKKTKSAAKAAEVLGELIDDVVGDDLADLESEDAQQLIDALSVEEGGADDMENARVIAEALKKELEATRSRRRALASRIEKGFDDLA